MRLVPDEHIGAADELVWEAGSIKWTRSNSVFIAFSSKEKGDDLIADLTNALVDWNPDPSRLFLARLQAEIDERGSIAQDLVLGKKHALAHWYRNLLVTEPAVQRWRIAEAVSRHSDQLMNNILESVQGFALNLIQSELLTGTDPGEICKHRFGVNLEIPDVEMRAHAEHNALVGSKSPSGPHLMTGHIFKVGDDHWLCASPACDLVPTQLSGFRKATYDGRMPFIAIKLQPVATSIALGKINSNRHLFIEIDNNIVAFCFNDHGDESSSPQWTQLYAANGGYFDENSLDFVISIVVSREKTLVLDEVRTTVVAQLRYEYALNLVQRLGVSMTRIGLDFIGPPRGAADRKARGGQAA